MKRAVPAGSPRSAQTGLSLALIGVLTAVDQLSKGWARHALVDRGHPLIPGLCDLRWVPNRGVVGGLYAAQAGPVLRWALVVVGLVMVAVLFRWWWTRSAGGRRRAVAVGCLIGGLLSNTIDRLIFGYVIDYIDIFIGSALGSGTINPADLAILVGVALLMPDLVVRPHGVRA